MLCAELVAKEVQHLPPVHQKIMIFYIFALVSLLYVATSGNQVDGLPLGGPVEQAYQGRT